MTMCVMKFLLIQCLVLNWQASSLGSAGSIFSNTWPHISSTASSTTKLVTHSILTSNKQKEKKKTPSLILHYLLYILQHSKTDRACTMLLVTGNIVGGWFAKILWIQTPTHPSSGTHCRVLRNILIEAMKGRLLESQLAGSWWKKLGVLEVFEFVGRK